MFRRNENWRMKQEYEKKIKKLYKDNNWTYPDEQNQLLKHYL